MRIDVTAPSHTGRNRRSQNDDRYKRVPTKYRVTDMPHKCTNCEHVFEDGSTNILNGCPNCGWNKFLYVPAERKTEEAPDEVAEAGAEEKTQAESQTDGSDTELEVKEMTVEANPDLQVESIRILEKGSYELNLEALLDREEIIMSIKEGGRYFIHLPSVFDKGKKNR